MLFGDYHRPSGTGILITERIQFGTNGIERQYHKCLDYEMPEPLEHYRALLDRTGPPGRRTSIRPACRPNRPRTFRWTCRPRRSESEPRCPPTSCERRLNQLAEFVHTGLLPADVGSAEFMARLHEDVPRIAQHESAITRQLAADTDYVALCHWNANIDNAWFWRDTDGSLRCGLMDWGCVSQMNLGMAIWGAMSGAETDLWNSHLDELLDLFVAEVHRCGGPKLDPARLRRHTLLYAAAMGVAWLLDVPALIRKRCETTPSTRKDPRIRDDESVRAPLQMLSNLLYAWERHRIGDLLDAALAENRADLA